MQDVMDKICQQWQSLKLDADYQAIEIVGRILRLSKNLEATMAKLHTDYGLKQGEFDVLATLKRTAAPELTPSQLHQSMLLTSGAMTSRLDRLENKGLIRRQHCQQDRRSIKVSLTTKGHELIDNVYPKHFETLAHLLDGLPTKTKKDLAENLRQLVLHIESPSTL